jgi:hypothetical protein
MQRGVIIKLGAAGGVLRSTPPLRALDPVNTGTKILRVTDFPDLLPTHVCEVVRPTAGTLARIAVGTWDFCWNLNKDPEACAIAASTKATEYRGYRHRDGVPYRVDKAAWHKFATGKTTRIAAAIAKAMSKRFLTSQAYLSGEKNIGFANRLLWQGKQQRRLYRKI